ncbi:MAG: XTP/dITP diphosphatase [Clostridia bacterium]|nr:XTP/dITP diphosphatase [Clostridia bacterium]
MTIVLATGNAHKLFEVGLILKELLGADVEVKMPRDFGFNEDVEEDGATFAENALIKADAIHRALSLPVIADDSGLCVDALGGAPGIYSARYGGEHGNDQKNNERLLRELDGVTARTARFVSAIAYVSDSHRFTVEGEVKGEILTSPRGEAGFGYDPLFYYAPKGKTLAELSADEKNEVSHRRAALAALVERWKEEGIV